MSALSDDDLDLEGLSDEELERAWDLWFALAQTTNADDPPYTHGVLVSLTAEDLRAGCPEAAPAKRRGAGQRSPGT